MKLILIMNHRCNRCEFDRLGYEEFVSGTVNVVYTQFVLYVALRPVTLRPIHFVPRSCRPVHCVPFHFVPQSICLIHFVSCLFIPN
jgi:hypothetical protein